MSQLAQLQLANECQLRTIHINYLGSAIWNIKDSNDFLLAWTDGRAIYLTNSNSENRGNSGHLKQLVITFEQPYMIAWSNWSNSDASEKLLMVANLEMVAVFKVKVEIQGTISWIMLKSNVPANQSTFLTSWHPTRPILLTASKCAINISHYHEDSWSFIQSGSGSLQRFVSKIEGIFWRGSFLTLIGMGNLLWGDLNPHLEKIESIKENEEPCCLSDAISWRTLILPMFAPIRAISGYNENCFLLAFENIKKVAFSPVIPELRNRSLGSLEFSESKREGPMIGLVRFCEKGDDIPSINFLTLQSDLTFIDLIACDPRNRHVWLGSNASSRVCLIHVDLDSYDCVLKEGRNHESIELGSDDRCKGLTVSISGLYLLSASLPSKNPGNPIYCLPPASIKTNYLNLKLLCAQTRDSNKQISLGHSLLELAPKDATNEQQPETFIKLVLPNQNKNIVVTEISGQENFQKSTANSNNMDMQRFVALLQDLDGRINSRLDQMAEVQKKLIARIERLEANKILTD